MLEDDGHEVAVFERFDEPRPVGSGIVLQPTGLAVLAALGLESEIYKCGKRIDRMYGKAMPAGKTVLDVNYSALGEEFHGLAVHRAALFDVLYAAVRNRNVQIHTGVDVSSASDIEAYSGVSFDVLIDASGARSRLRHFAPFPSRWRELDYGALWGSFSWPAKNFQANTLEQRYVGAHTMIGILPIGQHSAATEDQVAFFWSIKTANYEHWCEEGLDVWKKKLLSIWPETDVILEQITDASQMSLARYGHGTLRRPYSDKIVFLGDAAHSTSPQLGQGANMALLDAWSFATALRESGELSSAMRQYTESRRWHVRAFQLSSLALTPFYQSDSRVLAGLRDLLFHPASKLPIVRRIVAGLVSGMLAGPPKGLMKSKSV